MDPVTLARLSAGPPPSPIMSPEPDAGVTVLTAALDLGGKSASPATRGAGGSPRPPPTGSLPIPGSALRTVGKENGSAAPAGASPPACAGSSAPYGMSPPAALIAASRSPAPATPVAPYQALPVHGPVTITHHLTAGLPVVEPGEMSKEVRRRGRRERREKGNEAAAASQLPPPKAGTDRAPHRGAFCADQPSRPGLGPVQAPSDG